MSKIIDSNCLENINGKYSNEVATLMIELCEISYDKEGKEKSEKRYNELGFNETKFIENQKTDTQLYIVNNDDTIIVVFRGSHSDEDWATNFKCGKAKAKDYAQTNTKLGRVHKGFYNALSSVFDEIKNHITSIENYRSKDLYVTGHSLGGALTTLFFRYFDSIVPFECGYSIASPLVGTKKWSKNFNKISKGRFYRIVNCVDIVCKVPLNTMGYWHVNEMVYITLNGKIKRATKYIFRFFDQVGGLIKGIFTDNVGITDCHHPYLYYNSFAKHCGITKRLSRWEGY